MHLTEDNYIVYAMNHYQSPSCPTLEDFNSDLRIITYIKKSINNPSTKHRLILNHIITLFNCFGDAALQLLFFKVDRDQWGTLATFLLYINRMPEYIHEYGINLYELKLNNEVIEELRNL